jgi:Flp pilus assembly protein TadG
MIVSPRRSTLRNTRLAPGTPSRGHGRSGAAAVELACVLPLVALLLFGVLDIGRMVEVEQLLNNAARDGGRLAAVGSTLDPTTGNQVDYYASDVTNLVQGYLANNGINTGGLVVQFSDVTNPSATDPYEAQKLDQLNITVQLPFNNVRWTLIGSFMQTDNVVLSASATWFSMEDSSVSVPTTLPTS